MNRLREILDTEGLTQAELSRLSKVASGTINRYINQGANPSPATKAKIVKAINNYLDSEKYSIVDIFPEN